MMGPQPAAADGPVPQREAAIFGYFGGAVNVTDGRTPIIASRPTCAARRSTSTP
jgi:hypothetical protein